MNKDKILREHLVNLLTKGEAHMMFDEAVDNFPIFKINEIFPNGTYSFWHLLEHILRTQKDILDFCINPNYKEMEWPKDYWPDPKEKANAKNWQETIKVFRSDLKTMCKLIKNSKTDLYAKIAWGDGQTILREAMLIADHNAYHIGEFAIMRQVLKTWPKNHK